MMNSNLSEIQLYQLLFYVVFGILLFISFFIVNNYVTPLLKGKKLKANKHWKKIQLIAWLLFSGMFFVALFRENLFITLTFTLIILGVGWNFWSNIFSGIVIKFNNQFEIGEIISTDFVKGELQSINLSQSELINEKGETVIIPNRKLREVVLTHYHKKSNLKSHSFSVAFSKNETPELIYQLALNCPYISANQKIEVERMNENNYIINASVIDISFVHWVDKYFKENSSST